MHPTQYYTNNQFLRTISKPLAHFLLSSYDLFVAKPFRSLLEFPVSLSIDKKCNFKILKCHIDKW